MSAVLGVLFAGMGWAVVGLAVAAALALWAFGRALPTWAAPVLVALLALAFVGNNVAKTAQLADARQRASAAETREQKLIAEVATARADALAQVDALRAEKQQAVAALDAHHSKELSNAKHENDRLRTAARAGTVRVRIPGASCAARPGDLPSAPAAASLGDAAPEIAGDVRERVFDLRAEVNAAEAQIAALQDYARVCAGP